MNCRIEKNMLKTIINLVKSMDSFSMKLYKLGIYTEGTPHGEASDIIIGLLDEMTNRGGWISYWCWELQFGTQASSDTVTDSHGKYVPFCTFDDLWDFLNSNSEGQYWFREYYGDQKFVK